MSRFVKELKEQLTGTRKPVDPRGMNHILMDNRGPAPPYDWDTQQEYEFKAVYSILVTCYPKDLEQVKKDVVRQLSHEIYGEFIEQLHALQRALFSMDNETAAAIIDSLIDSARGDS